MADEQEDPVGRWRDPRWHYPDYPPGSVVEIRVHGVGGEPPTGMTRDPHPVRIDGDRLAGFHRACDPVVGRLDGDGSTSDPPDPAPLHVREVLAWGGQTSGTVRHALWVLLLPFALFNVAGRTHVTGSPRVARLQRATCRVLALTVTLAVVALTCGLVFDLIAAQCAGWGEACLGRSGEGPWLLAPFRRFGDDAVGRFGLAALVPTGVVLALWYSGRYGTRRLEFESTGPAAHASRRADEPTSLADGDFWHNAWPASRLRGAHATASFAWIATVLAIAIHLTSVEHAAGGTVTSVWIIVAAVGAATVIGTLAIVAAPVVAAPGQDRRLHAVLAALRAGGLGSLGFGIGAALLGRLLSDVDVPAVPVVAAVLGIVMLGWWALGTRWVPGGGGRGTGSAFRPGAGPFPNVSISASNAGLAGGALLLGAAAALSDRTIVVAEPLLGPDFASLASLPAGLVGPRGLLAGLFPAPYLPLIGLVALQFALLSVLAVSSVWHRPVLRKGRSELDRGSPIVANLTPVVVALLSLLLVTSVGAGLHAVVLDLFGTSVHAAAAPGFAGDQVLLVAPWWYGLTALVVAATPVVGGVAWWLLGRRRRRDEPDEGAVAGYLADAYGRARVSPVPELPRDEDRVRDLARRWMRQRLIRDAGPLLGVTVGILSSIVVATVVWLAARGEGFGGEIPLVAAATWGVALIPVVAVALIRSSLSDRGTRRSVGRIWDVLTFWPRVTHPFAPPCYGEALVPMLEQRVRRLLAAKDSTGGSARYRVILAGHSQGSVVSLAVAARLEESLGRVPRVALVSYGSPIAILYERYFRATLEPADGHGTSVYDRVRTSMHSWHHLLAMTEPFAFPFWSTEAAIGSAPTAHDVRLGWPLSLRLRDAGAPQCPGCDPPAGRQRERCMELLVRDPEQWKTWDGEPVGPGGHSTYHRHRDVDAHLARIACSLSSAG